MSSKRQVCEVNVLHQSISSLKSQMTNFQSRNKIDFSACQSQIEILHQYSHFLSMRKKSFSCVKRSLVHIMIQSRFNACRNFLLNYFRNRFEDTIYRIGKIKTKRHLYVRNY